MPKLVNYLENSKLQFELHEVVKTQRAAQTESAAPPKEVLPGAIAPPPLPTPLAVNIINSHPKAVFFKWQSKRWLAG